MRRAFVPKTERPLLTIILFDIDGTLVRTDGAGMRAMNRAFHDVFDIASAFDDVPMAGRTDRGILAEGARRAGIDLSEDDVRRFRVRYCERLHEALAVPDSGHGSQKTILPGVRTLLDALSEEGDVFAALLTGNCEAGARIKLEHFDLWKFFRCGAYGDEATDRTELFDVAMERVAACGAPSVPPGDVVVVGDTVLDVACARAAGARCVAVATGPFNADALAGAGADVAWNDLSDTSAFLTFLRSYRIQA